MNLAAAKSIYGGIQCKVGVDDSYLLHRMPNGRFSIINFKTKIEVWWNDNCADFPEAIEAAEASGFQFIMYEGSMMRSNACFFGRHGACWPGLVHLCECWCHTEVLR
jgi:hypothetical protein